ncbi:FAD-binding monooxygenase [Pisolithus croceorrhizus]|nr:FAD-binding monooxygenase [Pisolithus croceorrhizus]
MLGVYSTLSAHPRRSSNLNSRSGLAPTGIAATLMLVRNNVPMRIIEKESQHYRGQRDTGIQPHTFEVFHFLRVPKIQERANPILSILEHKRTIVRTSQDFFMVDYTEPTPAIPYVRTFTFTVPVETIVREYFAKLSCTVELGTRPISFSQVEKCIRAKVVKHRGDDGEEVEEDIYTVYLIGADGTRGMTRKQLGLTFLGTTRERNFLVVEDIHLEVKIEMYVPLLHGQCE